ncbi:MAG: glutamyl/glutaminyl-tRNA synthetase [Limisphaerales bacterium]
MHKNIQLSEQVLKTRIAPTPSGYLHEGNAFNFALTWAVARRNNGHILLRIDDLDNERVRDEYLSDVFQTLEWLGIDYDSGPDGPTDLKKNWSQKNRTENYKALLSKISDTSETYACVCSRSMIKKASIDGNYPGTCLHLGLPKNELGYNLRLRTKALNNVSWTEQWPEEKFADQLQVENDFIIRKKDGKPAYQITSLSDDLFYNINYIVRGEDLNMSTASQLILAEIIEPNSFKKAKFLHHPLMNDSEGIKLSKSVGSKTKSLIEEYGNPSNLYKKISAHLNISSASNAIELMEQLPQHFIY